MTSYIYYSDNMAKKIPTSKQNAATIDEYIAHHKTVKPNLSEDACRNDAGTLRSFCRSLGARPSTQKSLKEATTEDIQKYFSTITHPRSYNRRGTILTAFYKWVDFGHYRSRKIPERMDWFRYATRKDIRKQSQDKADLIVTDEEYNKLINSAQDVFGMWQAVIESLNLSGGRRNEVAQMNVDDLIHDEERNIIKYRLTDSKTVPRTVPLCAHPRLTLRWLVNHPANENHISAREFIKQSKGKNIPLWVCLSTNYFGARIKETAFTERLCAFRKKGSIDKVITPQSFRRTRATIMFSKRDENGRVVYDDAQMAKYFGWQASSVPARREQYDMRSDEEILNNMTRLINNSESFVFDYDLKKDDEERTTNEMQERIKKLEERLFKSELKEQQQLEQTQAEKDWKKFDDSEPNKQNNEWIKAQLKDIIKQLLIEGVDVDVLKKTGLL